MNNVDCYMNTIGDMQTEMDYFYHCKKFEYNHDFKQFSEEIFYDTLEFDVLNNDICLYLTDSYKCLLLVYLFD